MDRVVAVSFGAFSAVSSPDTPWHYYSRDNNSIVGEGLDFYALRGQQTVEYVGDVPVGWNGPNLYECEFEPGIHPRPW